MTVLIIGERVVLFAHAHKTACEEKKPDALHYRVHQNLEMAAGARGMDGGNILSSLSLLAQGRGLDGKGLTGKGFYHTQ